MLGACIHLSEGYWRFDQMVRLGLDDTVSRFTVYVVGCQIS